MQFLYIILLGGALFGGGYLYYKDTQATISRLEQNNVALRVAAEDNEASLRELSNNFAESQRQITSLTVRARQAEEYKDELIAKLNEHDLTKLTMARPGMIELRVNNATTEIFRDIEADTAIDTVE